MIGRRVVLNDRVYSIYGEEGPCFIYGLDEHDTGEAMRLYDRVRTNEPFMIAAIQATSWNDDFSPWDAPGVRGSKPFAGNGRATLNAVLDDLLPYIRENYPQAGPFIATGYSLAGLWSLWAFYESDAFDGCISGSGSLWFRDWDTYMESHTAQRESRIYLSLGVKEERGNPTMARVGDVTRRQYELLQADPKVLECTLEWNPGGHFADVPERMAKGIEWYLKEEK